MRERKLELHWTWQPPEMLPSVCVADVAKSLACDTVSD